MKSLVFILTLIITSPTFSNPTCKTQVKHVERIQKGIISQARQCKKLEGQKQLTCYQFLAANQEALSGALYYAEKACTKEAQIIIAKLRKEVK
jgi:hypothetical protein